MSRVKPQARGKKRRRSAEDEKELGQELLEKTPVRESRNSVTNVESAEMIQVIKETLQREGHECFSPAYEELWAGELAAIILRSMKYGIPEPGYGNGVKIKEYEFDDPPMHKKCAQNFT